MAYAAVVGFLVLRQLTAAAFLSCLKSAIGTSARIMIIIALSQVYIWVLALERTPEAIANMVTGLGLGPLGMLLVVDLIILIAGTVIDVSPAILLLTPVFLPALGEAGVSPIHFGVIGVCTSPPTTPHLVVGRSACRVGVGPSLNRSWAQRSRPVVQAGRRAFPGDESVVD